MVDLIRKDQLKNNMLFFLLLFLFYNYVNPVIDIV